MTDTAIRIEGIGKQYRIGTAQQGMYRYNSLRDAIGGFVKKPLAAVRGVVGRKALTDDNSFWALKDVSFEVKKGEVVGIIGRNGAGKSTLLKILSRITKPTTGHIELHGRVGSLLEVGTGFHPELSGRENIYLNGAILGMTRAEVNAKFDEIVAFSEIERFLDTPVKQYSSGMYTRLAFAVAAHLEPEVLVVDEVLAVGDAAFQKKCLGKMQDVAGEGRTVLFVSHNMAAVASLCDRGVFLKSGLLSSLGATSVVIDDYLDSESGEARATYDGATPEGNTTVLRRASLSGAAGKETPSLRFGEPFVIRLEWENAPETTGFCSVIRIFDASDRLVTVLNSVNCDILMNHGVCCVVPENPLSPGGYRIAVEGWIRPNSKLHAVANCLQIEIAAAAFDPTFEYTLGVRTPVALRATWSLGNVE